MKQAVNDVFIIGGGINGCGIARNAAGRGLSVVLAEQGDLASATSSKSTKLIHGGLRYLEYFELRLVREALKEREILLQNAPHIIWPLRFILPYHRDMRFENSTPASRLLARILPWYRGRRPAWMIHFGLFLYDRLGGRDLLPVSTHISLQGSVEGEPLKQRFKAAFEYSDCWVDDARLVVLNAKDAAAKGAQILTYHKVLSAQRVLLEVTANEANVREQKRASIALKKQWLWRIEVESADGKVTQHLARSLVNAAGPWVSDVLNQKCALPSQAKVRLVRGSHIITKRLFAHSKAYLFQGEDSRICFAIPYQQKLTLIGTTDAPQEGQEAICSDDERDYLLRFANRYFKQTLTTKDVLETYSGVRPLYDDGASSASAATRDYVLKLNAALSEQESERANLDGIDAALPVVPVLSIYGGKITTYRRLAESALYDLTPYLPGMDDGTTHWTADSPLPGGDFEVSQRAEQLAELRQKYPFLTEEWAQRIFSSYGTECYQWLGSATNAADCGRNFGLDLTQSEVDWLIETEWVRSADDLLWRRTKLGLWLNEAEVKTVSEYIAEVSATA